MKVNHNCYCCDNDGGEWRGQGLNAVFDYFVVSFVIFSLSCFELKVKGLRGVTCHVVSHSVRGEHAPP